MCKKCESLHSQLFGNHKGDLISINHVDNHIFFGLCKEKHHSLLPLEYFCKNHNKLCCAACVGKVDTKVIAMHKKCVICHINEIKKEKKNNLKECYQYLGNISKTIDSKIKHIKNLYSEKINIPEKLKNNIKNSFSLIRNILDKKEGELNFLIDKEFNNDFFNTELLKEVDLLPKELETCLESIQSIEKEWKDKKNLKLMINDCIKVEETTKKISKINEKLKIINELSNLEFKFKVNEIEEIKNFLEKIKAFDSIILDKK